MDSPPTTRYPQHGALEHEERDVTESLIGGVDRAAVRTTGVSLLRMLTFASIGASIALYLSGRRQDGIFVGLWAPTFEALKASLDKERERRR